MPALPPKADIHRRAKVSTGFAGGALTLAAYRRLTDPRIEQHESERQNRKKNRQKGEVHLTQHSHEANKFSDLTRCF